LIFYGRIRRMKHVQHAAALLAGSRTPEAIKDAEKLLDAARSKVWVEDLAVYHFVRGKLRMEQGDLDLAEMHLHTALGLGLDRASVKLNLAVLLVRKCQLNAALELLDDVELSDDPAVLDQARVMREVIAETCQGKPLAEIAARVARFRKKHLKKVDPSPEATLPILARRLGGNLSQGDREDACLLLGQLLVEARQGTWLAGLEPRDHRVLVGGILYSPAAMIDDLQSGDTDQLSLPPLSDDAS
jgi:tetratricopeptide (TPR) repeat protein